MYKGKRYYVSAQKLGGSNEADSMIAANDWWTRKLREIKLRASMKEDGLVDFRADELADKVVENPEWKIINLRDEIAELEKRLAEKRRELAELQEPNI